MSHETEHVAVMVRLPRRTLEYLDAEIAATEQRQGVRFSRTAVVRGLIEGFAQVNFPVAEAGPSPYHLRDAVTAALLKGEEQRA